MVKSELPRYERQLTERQQMLSEFLAQHGPDASPPANPSLPVLDAIQGGERRYTEIKCPALAIFPILRPRGTTAPTFRRNIWRSKECKRKTSRPKDHRCM